MFIDNWLYANDVLKLVSANQLLLKIISYINIID